MKEFNQTALTTTDPSAIAAGEAARARIQSAYIIAMNKPRNEDQARDRILEACKRPAFAERVEFSKPVANRTIKGPSIRFAELALREWTNIMADTQTLYEDDKVRRVRVSVLDLETNAQFCKEIQIRKTVERKNPKGHEVISERENTKGETVYIVLATDDEFHNKEAALISKALRNEGLRVIPSDITDEALETARETLRNRDAQDPKAAKKKVFDSLSSIGIKPKDVEKYLKHSVDTLSPVELENLRGMYTAIKEGSASWAEYINLPDKEGNGNQHTGADDLTDAIKDKKPSQDSEDGSESNKSTTSRQPQGQDGNEALFGQENSDKPKKLDKFTEAFVKAFNEYASDLGKERCYSCLGKYGYTQPEEVPKNERSQILQELASYKVE